MNTRVLAQKLDELKGDIKDDINDRVSKFKTRTGLTVSCVKVKMRREVADGENVIVVSDVDLDIDFEWSLMT